MLSPVVWRRYRTQANFWCDKECATPLLTGCCMVYGTDFCLANVVWFCVVAAEQCKLFKALTWGMFWLHCFAVQVYFAASPSAHMV